MSPEPKDLSFQLRNLPFLHTQYKPCKATIVSAGMSVTFELAGFFKTPGTRSLKSALS